MAQQDGDAVARRSLMAGMGIAAVAGLVATTTTANAQTRARGAGFRPMRHEVDRWFDELPGTHRIFIDSGSANGGAEALGYANNLYLATASAYSGESADPAIVVCFRHFSTPFGYGDALWAKYGEIFHSLIQYPDPATGAAPKVNLLNTSAQKTLGNRGVTIDALATGKGTHFAICGMATQLFASVVAQRTGAKAADVEQELRAGAVNNSHFVSAGVIALTRAQEYGYSVLISG